MLKPGPEPHPGPAPGNRNKLDQKRFPEHTPDGIVRALPICECHRVGPVVGNAHAGGRIELAGRVPCTFAKFPENENVFSG